MKNSLVLVAALVAAALASPVNDEQNLRQKVCGPFKGHDQACADAISQCKDKGNQDEKLACVHAVANGPAFKETLLCTSSEAQKDYNLSEDQCRNEEILQKAVYIYIARPC